MKLFKFFAVLTAVLCLGNINTYAQLKKAANIEKVKSFTNGSVVLHKTTMDSGEVYSVTLRNNSKHLENIVFYLGNKEEMLKNLTDLSMALKEGKKGDVFDFSACDKDYNLAYGKVLGQVCFTVSTPFSISTDFGRFFKATIDDILEFFQENKEKAENEEIEESDYQ